MHERLPPSRVFVAEKESPVKLPLFDGIKSQFPQRQEGEGLFRLDFDLVIGYNVKRHLPEIRITVERRG